MKKNKKKKIVKSHYIYASSELLKVFLLDEHQKTRFRSTMFNLITR